MDTGVDVSPTWLVGRHPVASDGRRVPGNTSETGILTYQTYLSISPLSSMSDSGQYSCDVLVTPATSPHILPVTSSESVTILVEGKHKL